MLSNIISHYLAKNLTYYLSTVFEDSPVDQHLKSFAFKVGIKVMKFSSVRGAVRCPGSSSGGLIRRMPGEQRRSTGYPNDLKPVLELNHNTQHSQRGTAYFGRLGNTGIKNKTKTLYLPSTAADSMGKIANLLKIGSRHSFLRNFTEFLMYSEIEIIYGNLYVSWCHLNKISFKHFIREKYFTLN